jgi:hypothetical protein
MSTSRADDPSPAPFPFIVGCGRSGSTMLRAMADAHPDLTVPPESHFIVELEPRAGGRRRPFDATAFLERLAASERFALWGLERGRLLDAFAAAPPRDYPEAVRAVFALQATAQGKSRYADKTPVYVLHVRRLARLFPEARFVHLVRDGRDVACSFLDLGWADTVEQAALHWRRRVLAGRRAGGRLPAERYVEVRYEDLVRDPELELRRFCTAIELPFEESMLDPSARASEIVRTTAQPHLHRKVALPPTPGLRDWRRDLTTEDVTRFELLAGDALAAFGDERLGGPPPRGLRRDVAVCWARWQAHRVRRRVERFVRKR